MSNFMLSVLLAGVVVVAISESGGCVPVWNECLTPSAPHPVLEHLQPFAPPTAESAVIIAGLDENQTWGAPNFQPDPQLYARKSAFLTCFYK
jgi:hypothetical protein